MPKLFGQARSAKQIAHVQRQHAQGRIRQSRIPPAPSGWSWWADVAHDRDLFRQVYREVVADVISRGQRDRTVYRSKQGEM